MQTITKRQKGILTLMGMVFLTSRLFLTFVYQTPASDCGVYEAYASELDEALKRNTPLYELHDGVIEYPPLSVFWMYSPLLVIHSVPDAVDKSTIYLLQWKVLYKIFCFALDLLLFVLMLLFLTSGNRIHFGFTGIVVFVLSGLLLFNFLYDRLDLVLGGIILLACLSVIRRQHWMIPLFILAVGINFKLVPLLLFPLFLVGSLPVRYLHGTYRSLISRDFILDVTRRVLFLIAACLLLFLPFYIFGGEKSLDFLRYHGDRGLQLESAFSSVLMMLNYVGCPVYVSHGFGAYNLESPLAPFCAEVSTLLVVLGVVLILLSFVWLSRTVTRQYPLPEDEKKSLAQHSPQLFLIMALVTLLFSIAASKVFSPQYLLWVVPIFGLLDYRNRNVKLAGWLFLSVCAITAMIFPYCYYSEFVHNPFVFNGQTFWEAPTLFASNLLFLRNILLIATVLLLLDTAKQERSINRRE